MTKEHLKSTIARWAGKNWRRPHWRILYYHGVDLDHIPSFRAQMTWFVERFEPWSISDGVKALQENSLPGPKLSVTFDDADLSVYEHAMPVLAELNIPACIYVVPGYVLKGRSFRDAEPRPTMNWRQLRAWIDAGLEIGSHTLTHVDAPLCAKERLLQECRIGKDILEQALGVPVVHFAYPWGQHNAHTQKTIIDAGLYVSIATIQRGSMEAGASPYYLLRERMNPAQSPQAAETTMRLADRLYGLRKLKRDRFVSYTDRHPEERWEALPAEELDLWRTIELTTRS